MTIPFFKIYVIDAAKITEVVIKGFKRTLIVNKINDRGGVAKIPSLEPQMPDGIHKDSPIAHC